jgi:hypothetical protein
LFLTGIGELLDLPGFIKVIDTYRIIPEFFQPAIAVSVILVELKIGENNCFGSHSFAYLLYSFGNSNTLVWNRGAQLWIFCRYLGQAINSYNCGRGYFYGGGVRSSVKALARRKGLDLKDHPAQ